MQCSQMRRTGKHVEVVVMSGKEHTIYAHTLLLIHTSSFTWMKRIQATPILYDLKRYWNSAAYYLPSLKEFVCAATSKVMILLSLSLSL